MNLWSVFVVNLSVIIVALDNSSDNLNYDQYTLKKDPVILPSSRMINDELRKMRFSEVWEREMKIREGLGILWMKKHFSEICNHARDPFVTYNKREIQRIIILLAKEYPFKIDEQLVLCMMKKEFPSILLMEYLELKKRLLMKKTSLRMKYLELLKRLLMKIKAPPPDEEKLKVPPSAKPGTIPPTARVTYEGENELKDKVSKEEMHSKALEESFGSVYQKPRITLQIRERTKLLHDQNKEDMDYAEHTFEDNLEVMQDLSTHFDQLLQEVCMHVNQACSAMDPRKRNEKFQEIMEFEKEQAKFMASHHNKWRLMKNKRVVRLRKKGVSYVMDLRSWSIKMLAELNSEFTQLMNKLKMFAEPGTIPDGALTLADFEDFEFVSGRLKVPTETIPTTAYFSKPLESTAYFSDATEEQLMTAFGTSSHFRFEVCKVVPRRNSDPTVYNISGYDELLLFGLIKAQNSFLDPSNNGSFYMFKSDPGPSVYTTTGCFYMFNRDYDDSLVLTSDTIPPQEICYHSIQVFTSLKVTSKVYGTAYEELIDFRDLTHYSDYVRAQPKPELPYPKMGQQMYVIENDLLELSDDNQDINFSEYFAKKPRGGFASLKLKGKDGYLELYYAALKYPVDATFEVEFFAPYKETKVAGRVMAYYGKDFDYDCDAAGEDDHYAIMFETTPNGFLLPGKINLMRSVFAVPAQFSIIIVAQLHEFFSEKVILSGSYEFRVPLHDPNSVGCIKGNDGVLLGLKVGWKLLL